MKILTLILSARSGAYPRVTQNGVFATWAKLIFPDQEVYAYYGGYEKEEVVGQEIHLTVPDTDILGKSLAVQAFALKNFEFDYLVKTSMSTFIRPDVLYNHLFDKPRTKYYGGHTLNIPLQGGAAKFFGYTVVTYPSGVNQIFSRDIVENIVANRVEITDHGYGEDFHIGLYLQRKGIYMTEHVPVLHILDHNMDYLREMPKSGLDKYIFYRCKTEFKDFRQLTGEEIQINPSLRNDDEKIRYLYDLYYA